MCPGWTRSLDFDFLATAVWMVLALSAAEIPVVTPLADSIDTVKFVSFYVSPVFLIKGKPSFLHF